MLAPAAMPTSAPDRPVNGGPFALEPLRWTMGSLAPVISSRTVQFHYSRLHAGYVDAANRLARAHDSLAGHSPVEIVRWARERPEETALRDAASEAVNHFWLWRSLTPQKKRPRGALGAALQRAFGDYGRFAYAFAETGERHFGSGWLWLVADDAGELEMLSGADGDCPEADGCRCLLAIDLWEHAYYLDHQERRREYLDAVIDRRLDWDFAAQRFAASPAG